MDDVKVPQKVDDPLADIAELLLEPVSMDGTWDPSDPGDAEELSAALAADGLLTDELLAVLGWAEEPDGFDARDVDPPLPDLGTDQLMDDLLATHRAVAASQAREALLVTELAHRRSETAVTELTGRKARGMEALSIGARAVAEEVALALTLSKTTGQSFTDTCVGLCLDAPDTLDALMAGDIDWAKAREILQLIQQLVIAQTDTNADLSAGERTDPFSLGRKLQERLLGRASRDTLAELKRAGRREMIAANPAAAEHRHKRARKRRAFIYYPDDDSMARLSAFLPADAGMRAKNALTRLAYHARAQGEPGDRRTLDQLRVDTLVETLTQAADGLHPASGESLSPDTAPSPSAGAGPSDSTGPSDSAEPPASDDSPTYDQRAGGIDDGYIPDTDLDDLVPNGGHTKDDVPSHDHGDHDDDDDDDDEPVPTGQPRASRAASRPAGLGCSTPSRASRSDPRVQITISASTLIGWDDNPAYLHGYGPIVASMARDVAATGTWRCAVTDPQHGTVLGLGTGTYSRGYPPTQRLRRHLQARDRVCRVPGCSTPAELCEIDHRRPWPDGPTCECCTECLCKTHHRMKHECGFTLSLSRDPSDPPGTLVWATPAGREYPSYPAQLANPEVVADSGGQPRWCAGECDACAAADATTAAE